MIFMKLLQVQDPHFLPHCGCDLQLTLNRGEALILVGENGIGKSTLMKVLYSSLKPEERVVVEQRTSEYFFDRKLETLKNFFLSGNLPHFDEQAFDELWRAFGLEAREDRQISQLSGGESQALKLTLALCKETSFYLLDEPSQFLDDHRRKILAVYLLKLLEKQKSILIIEHNRHWIPRGWRVQDLVLRNDTLTLGDRWTIS